MQRFDLKHPVMMDNDYAYWKALDNSYWPAFYLVNKKGIIVKYFAGEMHAGTDRARQVEKIIEMLLKEA